MAEDLEHRALVKMALMGDVESLNALADHIYDNNRQAAQASPGDGRMSVTQQDFQNAVAIAANDRAQFLAAADKFKHDYRDVCERPDLYEYVKQADTSLAQSQPGLPYLTRLRRAGSAVRRWKDENEDGDERYNRVVVKQMQKSRGAAVLAEPDDEDITQIYESDEPDDIESEHAATIAEMAGQRKAAQLALANAELAEMRD